MLKDFDLQTQIGHAIFRRTVDWVGQRGDSSDLRVGTAAEQPHALEELDADIEIVTEAHARPTP